MFVLLRIAAGQFQIRFLMRRHTGSAAIWRRALPKIAYAHSRSRLEFSSAAFRAPIGMTSGSAASDPREEAHPSSGSKSWAIWTSSLSISTSSIQPAFEYGPGHPKCDEGHFLSLLPKDAAIHIFCRHSIPAGCSIVFLGDNATVSESGTSHNPSETSRRVPLLQKRSATPTLPGTEAQVGSI